MELRKAVEKYLSNLKLITNSEDTIYNYSSILRNDFIPYFEKKFNGMVYINEIKMPDIEKYLNYQKKVKGNANISVNRYFYVLRSFFKYLKSRELIKKNYLLDMQPLNTKSKEKEILSLEEIDKLVQAIDHDLIRLIVKTLSLTGIRVSELCSLKLENVSIKDKKIYVVNGKGGKDRTVPIADSLIVDLKDYIENDRPKVNTNNFFALEKSGGVSRQYINTIIKKTVEKLGWEKNISSHCLRHSLATNLLRVGSNVKDVAQILGHSDIRTTSIYLHSNDDELSKAVNLLDR